MEEQVKVLRIQVEGTQTVQGLRKEISDLRDALLNCEEGSEDYRKVVNQLVQDQKTLASAMNAGKNGAENVAGSYNALQAEMTALRKVWKEVGDEASRNEIGARIMEINTQLKEMDSSIGNNQRRVGSYEEALKNVFLTPQQKLRELRKELAGLQVGTVEYNRVFREMSKVSHDVREQTELLKYSSSDLGDMLGNLVGITGSLIGGFSALNATMGLLGSTDEDVQKAILKIQQLMALVQGLQALEPLGKKVRGLFSAISGDDATNSMEGLKDAVTAVGGAYAGAATSSGAFAAAQGASAVATANVGKEMVKTADAITEVAVNQGIELTTTQKLAYTIKQLNKTLESQRERVKKMIETHHVSDGTINRLNRTIQETTISLRELEIVQSRYISGLMTQEEVLRKLEDIQDEAHLTSINVETAEVQSNTTAKVANTAATEANTVAEAEMATATDAATGSMVTQTMTFGGLIGKLKGFTTGLWGFIKSIGTWVKANPIATLSAVIVAELVALGKGLRDISNLKNELKLAGETRELEKLDKQLETHIGLVKARGAAEMETFKEEISAMEKMNSEYADYAVKVAELFGDNAEKTEEAYDKWLEYHTQFVEKLTEGRYALEGLLSGVETAEAQKGMTDLEKEVDRITNQFENAKVIAGQLFDNGIINAQEYLKYLERIRTDLPLALEQAKSNTTGGGKSKWQQEEEEIAKLLKTIADAGKTELEKLKDKYDAEMKLFKKHHKDTTALTKKFEEDRLKLRIEKLKKYYDSFKEWNDRQNSLLNQDSEEYYQAQIEDARALQYSLLNAEGIKFDENNNPYAVLSEELVRLNAQYGLSMKNVADLGQQIQLANKAVDVATEAYKKYASAKKMALYNKESNQVRTNLERDTAMLDIEQNRKSSPIKITENLGWYGGISPKDQKKYLKERQEMIMKSIDDEIAIYAKAKDDINLIQADRDEASQKWSELLIERSRIEAEQIAENNDLLISSFQNVTDSIMSMTNNLADIMGNVANIMADNAERQLEAGKIGEGEYEERLKKAKDFEIAQATINTISGAVGAFTGITRDTGGWGIAAAAVQAAAVIAAGFAQIKQIRNTKLGSGSSQAPTINLPKLDSYQPEYTQNATRESDIDALKNAIGSQKIYVSVTDINKAQNANKTKVTESTF